MRKTNKKAISAIILAFIIVAAAAALWGYFDSRKEQESNAIAATVDVYYINNSESSSLVAEAREIHGESLIEIVKKSLDELKVKPKNENYSVAVAENIGFMDVKLSGRIVNLSLSREYSELKSGEELLCRAAIVWTLSGLSFVDGVVFYLDGEEMMKTNGEPLGAMSRDDIVLDADIKPEPMDTTEIVLYFADDQATKLVAEIRNVEVNPNHIERCVMEQLILGPQVAGNIATVPPETKIRDIKTVDGVCYVDLSNEFVTKHNGGSTGELITIASIVRSLTQLESIDKVQFLIEGEKKDEFKGHVDFSKAFGVGDLDY